MWWNNKISENEKKIAPGHRIRLGNFLREFFENQIDQDNILYKYNPIKSGTTFKLGTITKNIYDWIINKINMTPKDLTFSNFKDAFLRFSYTFGYISDYRTAKIIAIFNTEPDNPISRDWDDIAFNLCLYLWSESQMNDGEVKEILGPFNYLAFKKYFKLTKEDFNKKYFGI